MAPGAPAASPSGVRHPGRWKGRSSLPASGPGTGPARLSRPSPLRGVLYTERGALSLRTEQDRAVYESVRGIASAAPSEVARHLALALALRGEPVDLPMASHILDVIGSADPPEEREEREEDEACGRAQAAMAALEEAGLPLPALASVAGAAMGIYGRHGRLGLVLDLDRSLRVAAEADASLTAPDRRALQLKVVRAALPAAAAAGGLAPALALAAELRRLGGTLDAPTSASLLACCVVQKDFETAEVALAEMEKDGSGPGDVHRSYCALLRAWAAAGRLRRALRGLRELEASAALRNPNLRFPDQATYAALAAAAADTAGDQETACALLAAGWSNGGILSGKAGKAAGLAGQRPLPGVSLPSGASPALAAVTLLAWLRGLRAEWRADGRRIAAEDAFCVLGNEGEPEPLDAALSVIRGGEGKAGVEGIALIGGPGPGSRLVARFRADGSLEGGASQPAAQAGELGGGGQERRRAVEAAALVAVACCSSSNHGDPAAGGADEAGTTARRPADAGARPQLRCSSDALYEWLLGRSDVAEAAVSSPARLGESRPSPGLRIPAPAGPADLDACLPHVTRNAAVFFRNGYARLPG